MVARGQSSGEGEGEGREEAQGIGMEGHAEREGGEAARRVHLHEVLTAPERSRRHVDGATRRGSCGAKRSFQGHVSQSGGRANEEIRMR